MRAPRPKVVAALIRRDLAIASSYTMGIGLDLLVGFINLALYFFISRTFGDPGPQTLGGAPTFFAFAAVGVAVTTVLQSAAVGLSTKVRDEQLTGTLENLIAQPLTVTELALGVAAFPVFFAVVRVALYLVAADLLFGLGLMFPDWVGVTLVLLASGLTLAVLGVAFASIVLITQRGNRFAAFAVVGMCMVSGAFFPRQVLPGWLDSIGGLLPTRFAFDGARSALFVGSGWTDDVLRLIAFGAVALPLSFMAFSAAVSRARWKGSLGEY